MWIFDDNSFKTFVSKMDTIINLLTSLNKEILNMSAVVDNLTAKVAKIEGAADSALVLLQGLSDYIKANVNDPVALQALADSLDTEGDKIAAAVAANPVPPVA